MCFYYVIPGLRVSLSGAQTFTYYHIRLYFYSLLVNSELVHFTHVVEIAINEHTALIREFLLCYPRLACVSVWGTNLHVVPH